MSKDEKIMNKVNLFRRYLVGLLFLSFFFPIKAAISYWDGHSYSTSWYDPSKSVYYIQSAEDLCGLSYLLRPGSYEDFEGKEVILMVDINLNGYEWETLGRIEGSYYYAFNGVFNGNGKTVSGLKITKINNGTIRTTGLFGVVMEQGTIIKNLTVEGDINIGSRGTADIGAIAGTSMATIYNCISKVNISVNSSDASSDINVGGIVGKAYGMVRDCQTYGNIRINQDGISGCRVGGIAGSSVTADIGAGIIRCKSASDITVIGGKDAMVGGISSLIRENNENNLYTGCVDVNGCHFSYVGGIVASMSSEVKNCLMLGSFTGYGDYYYKGAIMATQEQSVIIDDCYYREGLPSAASYGYPVAEAELYSGSSLPGFDPSIWNFREGEYPDLFFEFEDLIEMPAVDRIELDKTDLTLEIGDAIRLYPTLYPSGATGKIVWSSSDDYVAVVNSSGLVVARNGGIAYISVSMTDNLSISDVCRVTVNKSPTANESVPVDDLEVRGLEGSIMINATMPQDFCIYALNGEIINQGKLMGGENIISVLKGIYIVKVKNYIKKVIVL